MDAPQNIVTDWRFLASLDGWSGAKGASLFWQGGPCVIGGCVGAAYIRGERSAGSARFAIRCHTALGAVIRELMLDEAIVFRPALGLPSLWALRDVAGLLALAARHDADARGVLGAKMYDQWLRSRADALATLQQ
jgi:hypothetical protein